MEIIKLSPKALNKAVKILREGGVVVFPTDTVYGFLALAGNKKAVEKIFKIKKRPKSKPLAVFVKNIKMAKELAKISNDPASAKGFGVASQEKILRQKWPGSYTFVLHSTVIPAKAGIQGKGMNPGFRVKPGMTIALRIPNYKPLNSLLKKINKPLAQTSVNISGQPELNKIFDIIKIFEKIKIKPDLIIDAGNLPKRKPSHVIDLTGKTFTILR